MPDRDIKGRGLWKEVEEGDPRHQLPNNQANLWEDLTIFSKHTYIPPGWRLERADKVDLIWVSNLLLLLAHKEHTFNA